MPTTPVTRISENEFELPEEEEPIWADMTPDERIAYCTEGGGLPPQMLADIKRQAHADRAYRMDHPDGRTEWLLHDVPHRLDGPALIHPDGFKAWYKDGVLHRDDDGEPAVLQPTGAKEWWVEGKRHRVGGPAVLEPDGSQYWYQHGELHREDGPALIDHTYGGRREWHFRGVYVTSAVKAYFEAHGRADAAAAAPLTENEQRSLQVFVAVAKEPPPPENPMIARIRASVAAAAAAHQPPPP